MPEHPNIGLSVLVGLGTCSSAWLFGSDERGQRHNIGGKLSAEFGGLS
jgi:hypothetical protein